MFSVELFLLGTILGSIGLMLKWEYRRVKRAANGNLYAVMKCSPLASKRMIRIMSVRDGWRHVWAASSDDELSKTLRDYFWLAAHTHNAPADRIAQLIAETKRRGKPAIVEDARRALLDPRTFRHPASRSR
jgi:hypothetical protein